MNPKRSGRRQSGIISYFNKIANALPTVFKPKSIERFLAVINSGSTRFATYIKEPFFSSLFAERANTQLIEVSDPKLECQKLRQATINELEQGRSLFLESTKIKKAYKLMDEMFKLEGVSFDPLSQSVSLDRLPTATSSSSPDFIKPKSDNIPNILEQIEAVFYELNSHDGLFDFTFLPIIISWRTQVRKSGIKFRQFFPLPMLVQGIEMMFVGPFLDHFAVFKDTAYAYAWKFPNLRDFYLKVQDCESILSLDAVGYDASLQNELLLIGFFYLKRHLKITNNLLNRLFDSIVYYHLNCKIITSNIKGEQYIINKKRGLMSGSVFTNLLGTIINAFLLCYFIVDNNLYDSINLNRVAICSDDILIGVTKDVELSDLISYYKKKFDVVISEVKSETFYPKQRIFFLGYYIDDKGRYLDEFLSMRQLVFSESFIPLDVLSEEQRVISKACSLLFKCTDGYEFFNKNIKNAYLKHYNIDQLPKSFVQLFTITGIDQNTTVSFKEFAEKGWLLQ